MRLLRLAFAFVLALAPAYAGHELPRDPSPLIFAQPVLDDFNRPRTVGTDGVRRVLLQEDLPGDPLASSLERDPAFTLARRLHRWFRERHPGRTDRPIALAITVALGDAGPGHFPHPVEVRRLDGSTVTLDAFLVLSPFPASREELPGLEALDRAGLLGRVLVHEVGHLVMHEAYRPDPAPSGYSTFPSGRDRDVPEITDPYLAFSEGWAEAHEALVATLLERTVASPDVHDPAVRRLTRIRHEWLVEDRYVWEDLVEKTGRPLGARQLVSREGFVGSQLHEILAHRAFVTRGDDGTLSALDLALTILEQDRPRDYPEFVRAALTRAPERRALILRVLLEGARYTTMDPDAGAQVAEVYRLARALKRTHPGSDDRREIQAEADEAQARWKSYKEELFEKAVTGALDPFRALPAVAAPASATDGASAYFGPDPSLMLRLPGWKHEP